MSGTEDEDEEHSSVIKTPKQLITVLVAAFVFPVLIIMLLGHLAVGNVQIDPNTPAFSDKAVAQRLKPVLRPMPAERPAGLQLQHPPAGETIR